MADNEQNLEPIPVETTPVDVAPPADNVPLTDVLSPTDNALPVDVPVAAPIEPPVEPAVPPQITPAPALDQKFSGNMANWKNLLVLALAKKQQKKQDKLNKILSLAQAQATITNRQVKKLLRCTQLTAWRYLKLLEKQSKLKRLGNHNTPTYEMVK